MTDHVYRKFSNHIEDVKALMQKDATFREIVADYEEMCAWLDDHCRLEGRPCIECYHAMEVIRDLEDEITKTIEDLGFGIKAL